MSEQGDKSGDARPAPKPARRGAFNAHFVVALVVVCLTGLGINVFKRPEVQPIEWPKGVRVSKDYRLLSLPKTVGPFELVEEPELKADDIEALGIGTIDDEKRYPNRSSSWYGVGIYQDQRKDESDPFLWWRLEIFYYTGLRDNVPHVPERCLGAAGFNLLSRKPVKFRALAARPPWDEDVQFRRVHYNISGVGGVGSRDGAEYYVFSVNGEPMSRAEEVRLTLALSWITHSYFAKIQFTPVTREGISSTEAADEAAQEFMSMLLPVVLKALPTQDDIAALKRDEKAES